MYSMTPTKFRLGAVPLTEEEKRRLRIITDQMSRGTASAGDLATLTYLEQKGATVPNVSTLTQVLNQSQVTQIEHDAAVIGQSMMPAIVTPVKPVVMPANPDIVVSSPTVNAPITSVPISPTSAATIVDVPAAATAPESPWLTYLMLGFGAYFILPKIFGGKKRRRK